MVGDFLNNIKDLLNDFLYKDYAGKTIKDWFLLVGGYSFIIWFAILGFIAYNFYKTYKILHEREREKIAILNRKNQQISHIREQIREIGKAYNILKSYFPTSRVTILKTLLQRDFIEEIKKIKDWQSFASEKYVFPKGQTLLYKDNISIYKFQFQDISLLNDNMQQFQKFYNQLLNADIEIKGDINLTKLPGYYVLYFNPGKGNRVIFKTYKYYGFLKNIFKINIPLTGSYFNIKQLRLHDYSKSFVAGWYLELTKGGF